jgi:hypothetical protein
MENADETVARAWRTVITAKEKSAIQRSVNRLLDVLAPEKTVKRGDQPQSPIGQHRTPAGCVLQGDGAAVSVSWFADTRGEKPGELHVNVWRGVVALRGSAHRKPGNATLVKQVVLLPTETSLADCIWRRDDGKEFDTLGMAEHCTALLGEEIALCAKSGLRH